MHDLELLISDLNGVPRGKTVDGAAFDTGKTAHLAAGIFFQCITGDYAEDAMEAYFPKDNDLLLAPDWDTCRPTPWKPGNARQVICETFDKNGEPVVFDPRNLLKRVIDLYAQRGWRAVVAPEIEFYLLQRPGREDSVLLPAVGVDGRVEYGGEAYSSDGLDKYAPLLDEVRAMGARMGIPIQAMVHELGPGQIELNVAHDEPLVQADRLFLVKRLVRACTAQQGQLGSFMAKPMAKLPGSGLHLHVSLVDQRGNNLFALENGKAPVALRRFIAGMQTYFPSAFALIAPHANSYRRFVSGFSAPINLAWGYDNRTAGFRVPYSDDRNGRVENRVAGADANPYLFIATSLACGLLGLLEGNEPSDPVAGNAYDRPADLPQDLPQALRVLAENKKLRKLLGKRFIDGFVSVKQQELRHFDQQVTPWEISFLGSLL